MILIDGQPLAELRCSKCDKLICHQNIALGTVALDCPRCGKRTIYRFKMKKKL